VVTISKFSVSQVDTCIVRWAWPAITESQSVIQC